MCSVPFVRSLGASCMELSCARRVISARRASEHVLVPRPIRAPRHQPKKDTAGLGTHHHKILLLASSTHAARSSCVTPNLAACHSDAESGGQRRFAPCSRLDKLASGRIGERTPYQCSMRQDSFLLSGSLPRSFTSSSAS
mmetsp:Transcript_12633/g.36454  ORF Transcript_12633/g.36454 Transcript_12633/m.36454 type:complete len:140 (-) Transcript_12633:1511-1930(-)